MSDRRTEILEKETSGTFDECEGRITGIHNAMDEYFKERALELLQFMVDKHVDINWGINDARKFLYKGEWVTKEQLFENFL